MTNATVHAIDPVDRFHRLCSALKDDLFRTMSIHRTLTEPTHVANPEP